MMLYLSQSVINMEQNDYVIIGAVLFLLALTVGMAVYVIYAIIINEKNFRLFRNNLKVGDDTRNGKVTRIDGKNITIEQVRDLDWVYPPDNGTRDNIYRYKSNG